MPVHDITGLPAARELRLVSAQTGKAKNEVQLLEEVVDNAFPSRRHFVLLETRHRGHAHVEAFVTVFLELEKELAEKIIHNAVGSVGTAPHQISRSFPLSVRGQDINEGQDPMVSVHSSNDRG